MFKDEKIDHVQAELLAMIAEVGISDINISHLAKRAGVSRTWIYLYLGNSRKNLIEQAAIGLGKRFTEMENDIPHVPTGRAAAKEWLLNGNTQLVADIQKYPWLPALYFQHFSQNNVLGEVIRQIGSEYLNRIENILATQMNLDKSTSRLRAGFILKLRMSLSYDWSRAGCKDQKQFKKDLDEAVLVSITSALDPSLP